MPMLIACIVDAYLLRKTRFFEPSGCSASVSTPRLSTYVKMPGTCAPGGTVSGWSSARKRLLNLMNMRLV